MLLATLPTTAELLSPAATIGPGTASSQKLSTGVNDIRLVNTGIDDGSDFGPGSIAMADLNGDGIPDLVAANSGADRVLVYLGLGNGQLASEAYGGDGFATGIYPVGVSIADLNGDGRPDLIVANERSNDVTILMNNAVTSNLAGAGRSGQQQITFEAAATIKTGRAPVSAVIGIDGEGERYLAVADSGSNDVMIFPETGIGTFSGTAVQIIPLGLSPSLLVPMQWKGQPALVSLDRSQNAISLITGLGESSTRVLTIDSGGVDPVAAESFASGASSGLMVANGGDGSIAIFVASPGGLKMTSNIVSSHLMFSASPSLAGVRNLGAFLFTPTSDAGTSALVGFRLIGQTLTPNTETLIGLTPQHQLQPLRQSDLSLLSTLLPVSVQVTSVGARTGSLAAVPAVSTDGLTSALIQAGRGNAPPKDSAITSSASVAAGDETDSVTKLSAVNAPVYSGPPWENYVSGIDEAIEQFHKERIEGAARSPSAAEASTASRLPAGGAVAEKADSSSVGDAKSVTMSMGFEATALHSLPVPGLASMGSGPAAQGEGADPAISKHTAVREPVPPERGGAAPKEPGRNRSLGLRAMVAAAAIAPGVLAGFVGSTLANRRRSCCSRRARSATGGAEGR